MSREALGSRVRSRMQTCVSRSCEDNFPGTDGLTIDGTSFDKLRELRDAVLDIGSPYKWGGPKMFSKPVVMETDPAKFWRPLCSGTLPAISPLDTLQDSERCSRLEYLLPGIQNEITLDRIASKLSWKDFHVLSSVSRGWRHAIQSRLVYDARVRSETRESLALISYGYLHGFCKIALYSTRDRSYYLLPPIPSVCNGGIPFYSQFLSLDGKVYVLGGSKNPYFLSHSRKVFVLDLAGQRLWKRCASMTVRRCGLKCSVTNGKIYVFGKTESHSYGGEVYDPKENTWSTIKTTIFQGLHRLHKVEALGQDVFLYGYGSVVKDSRSMVSQPEFLFYHPVEGKWGEFKHFDRGNDVCTFVADGSLHSMSGNDIYIHDVDGNSWRQLHTFSFAGDFKHWSEWGLMISVLAVEHDLLVFRQSYTDRTASGIYLFHCKGFNGDKKEIRFEKALVGVVSEALFDRHLFSMALLQL